jgi:Holliday junction resolvasome RuvABC endonuclease subunit
MKAEPAPDAADALAIAVCHAMQAAIGRRKAA